MRPHVKIFKTSDQLAKELAQDFIISVQSLLKQRRHVSIVLSGGTTPQIFFTELALLSHQFSLWDRLLFFWGDERCVVPEHSESNYGVARKLLFEHVPIPEKNIFRIRGENDPEIEAERYASIIREALQLRRNQYPKFDWIFLGMGTDGHTASLFPGSNVLSVSHKLCVGVQHPQTDQMRVTLTLPVLNHAHRVSFLVTGAAKKEMVYTIINRKKGYLEFPAARVSPSTGKLEWYLDNQAAKLISG